MLHTKSKFLLLQLSITIVLRSFIIKSEGCLLFSREKGRSNNTKNVLVWAQWINYSNTVHQTVSKLVWGKLSAHSVKTHWWPNYWLNCWRSSCYTELLSNHISKCLLDLNCVACLRNNNHNEASTQQSLNFDENQTKQAMKFQITLNKDALYSKELFYIVHLQYDTFHN